MRFIVQQLRKIGRDVIKFEMSEDKTYLEGRYKGRRVRIYKRIPTEAVIDDGHNWITFGKLGKNQIKRVRQLFDEVI